MNRDEASAAIDRMVAGEIDILIGTQMAAKGHHFPKLTLVAVVDADLGLNGGDLRAAERTFQLLYQVAGRAGREDRPGRALVQTHMPEHPVMQALVSGDRDRFVAAELADRAGRRHAALWPAGVADHLRSRSRRGRQCLRAPWRAARRIRTGSRCSVPRRRRWRCCAAATAGASCSRPRAILRCNRCCRRWLERIGLPGSVRLQIDVDPYSFL